MRASSLVILACVLAGACRASEQPNNPNEPAKPERQTTMPVELQWLGHASFKIRHDDTTIYIDPWKLTAAPHDAAIILVSHSHSDHYSPDDITKISNDSTRLIASADVAKEHKNAKSIKPGQTIDDPNVKIVAVAAYNPDKPFHPRQKNWVGFVIEIGQKRIYYAGDTDITEEMKALKDIDVVLLPVGGKYTMNAEEAAAAVDLIKPRNAVPYHYGDIVGSKEDGKRFAELAKCKVTVMQPGQTIKF